MEKAEFGDLLDKINAAIIAKKGNFGVECVENKLFKQEYGRAEFVIIVPVEDGSCS